MAVGSAAGIISTLVSDGRPMNPGQARMGPKTSLVGTGAEDEEATVIEQQDQHILEPDIAHPAFFPVQHTQQQDAGEVVDRSGPAGGI